MTVVFPIFSGEFEVVYLVLFRNRPNIVHSSGPDSELSPIGSKLIFISPQSPPKHETLTVTLKNCPTGTLTFVVG